jgi:hypothetical protein
VHVPDVRQYVAGFVSTAWRQPNGLIHRDVRQVILFDVQGPNGQANSVQRFPFRASRTLDMHSVSSIPALYLRGIFT